jgi:hypothetical protein
MGIVETLGVELAHGVFAPQSRDALLDLVVIA